MTQPNIRDAAKQGDPQAIAALMNRSLQPKGITAKVKVIDGCLHIMLEAKQVPNQPVLAAYIFKGVKSLEISVVKSLAVYGRQSGEDFPEWTERFDLTELLPKASVEPQAVPLEKALTPKLLSNLNTPISTLKPTPSQTSTSFTFGSICLLVSILSVLLAFVYLFISFSFSLIFFVLGGLSIGVWALTPEGKAAFAENAAQIKKQAELAEQAKRELGQKLSALNQDPSNADLAEEILILLGALNLIDLKPRLDTIAFRLLLLRPLDDQVRQAVFELAKKAVGQSVLQQTSGRLYALALECLQSNSTEPKLKQYVLEVGRWHFGKIRNGSPTIYDEQAIQNDILVRSRN